MSDDIHIASFLVHHRPEADALIDQLTLIWGGLEVAARDQGRSILLHEVDDTRTMLDCMDAVQSLPGVISVNLVYHHAEPRSALNAPVERQTRSQA
ncbi:MAG: chaperone NapD [Rhodospirillaceae bacterium]|nr:chaperone NapD [Rhodospirillaceae bacterium]